jgi:hypothetical protein
MLIPSPPPSEDALIRELIAVRDEGLVRLRRIELPALVELARLVTADEQSIPHVVIETLLRRATLRLGGGAYGDAAVALFGLDVGTRGLNSRLRRELAAEALDRTFETFRKNYELGLIQQVATQMLVLASEQRTRETRHLDAAAPQESAMPSVWLDRFAAYFRIWASASGLANDLIAYVETVRDDSRSWDRRFGAEGGDDPGYSQEEQAEGYALFALFHYARFEWELRQFVTEFGGQWLLSDALAEEAVSDAVHRVTLASPCNERDQSLLRMLVSEAHDQEMHAFINALSSTDLARETFREWLEWLDSCRCETVRSSAQTCQVHTMIAACEEYMRLIDDDWRRLADWYHVA